MRALLNLTAETAARYLENLEDRSVAPSPEALAGLTELRRAFARTADGSRMRAGDAGSHRFAGDDGHGRPAVLRIRDRRLASGGAGWRTGWPAPGISARACSRRRRSGPCWKRSPWAGCWMC